MTYKITWNYTCVNLSSIGSIKISYHSFDTSLQSLRTARTHRNTPPPAIDHHTTTQLLKQTTTIFTSHFLTFLTFLFLSFLIFTFRCNVENGTHYLTSFIDRDPSLISLLSHLDIAGRSHYPHHEHHVLRHRRRCAFLHFTRVGTLDDDFFSGDVNYDRSLFGSNPNPKPQLNHSYLILNPKLGFSSNIPDNGIRAYETIRSGVPFKAPEQSLYSDQLNETHDLVREEAEGNEGEIIAQLQFFIRGLELGRRDATVLLFIAGILSVAYGYVVLGFLVTYAWVLGTVFFVVVNDLLGKYRSFFRTLWDGSNLGLKRLSGFIIMRWAVRDALTQSLGIWCFGEIKDQYLFFKIFVRLKLMPFSIMTLWIKRYERESLSFVFLWFFWDMLVAFIFSVDAWVAMVDSRKSGREVLKEGCHLLSTMLGPAISIKCLEGIICGSFTQWILTRFLGNLFASAFQSVMEVYFMVAWLAYYLAVRYKDATLFGRSFGRMELEGFLEDFR
ncbi:unnamed protein product [Ilex paraguariensis]|uniref:Transmembrane protein n=1 Tax=Ilex paraguariensis TaxID=185542 RepID=A0ABC8TRJ7_9AQUA